MDLPNRKLNRLKNYDYSQNGAYFITICTKNRANLFGHIVGNDAHIVPQIELSKIGIVVQQYILTIPGVDQFVIMPNHIHLIVIISPPANEHRNDVGIVPYGVPQSIKSLKTLVSKQIGFSPWQKSFYDRIIRNEDEYQIICKYIKNNPLNWQTDNGENGDFYDNL